MKKFLTALALLPLLCSCSHEEFVTNRTSGVGRYISVTKDVGERKSLLGYNFCEVTFYICEASPKYSIERGEYWVSFWSYTGKYVESEHLSFVDSNKSGNYYTITVFSTPGKVDLAELCFFANIVW